MNALRHTTMEDADLWILLIVVSMLASVVAIVIAVGFIARP